MYVLIQYALNSKAFFMFDTVVIPDFILNFLRFNPTYNFIYGLIIIGFILGIVYKSNLIFKETKQKKIIFFATMFFISGLFEFLHIFVIFHNNYIEFLNVFLNRFYQCIGLLGLLFIRENPRDEKVTFKDFWLPVGSFALVLLLEAVILGMKLNRDIFPNLLNSTTAFGFISVLCSFIFVRLIQKKNPFTLFNLGLLFLAASSLYLINESYYNSWYRHLIHIFRLCGNALIFIDLVAIKEKFFAYRFRLKLILLPNLYMILFFISFILLGNLVFDLNFTEKIYSSFIGFYFLCLVIQFIYVSSLTYPLTQISRSLMEFKPGEKPKLIKITTNDEIAILAQNINRVSEKEWQYTNEIHENQEQIKELMRSRDTFIASLSHDLKSPIFSEQKIMEFILMDRDTIKISDFIEYIEEMYKTNEEILRIVNNLLTVYHLDSNEFELNYAPTNINSIIKSSAKTLGHLARDVNIEIVLELDSQIPLINADEDMIRRVIINLASNAIKHSQNSARLKISSCRKTKEVIIAVQDFGKGILLEDQKNIFQKYPTAKRKVGSGLGLYISKQIIDAHKGKIWFESKEGEGTIFYFTLPL